MQWQQRVEAWWPWLSSSSQRAGLWVATLAKYSTAAPSPCRCPPPCDRPAGRGLHWPSRGPSPGARSQEHQGETSQAKLLQHSPRLPEMVFCFSPASCPPAGALCPATLSAHGGPAALPGPGSLGSADGLDGLTKYSEGSSHDLCTLRL